MVNRVWAIVFGREPDAEELRECSSLDQAVAWPSSFREPEHQAPARLVLRQRLALDSAIAAVATTASPGATMNVFMPRIVSVGQCRVKPEFPWKQAWGTRNHGRLLEL
jgi:hypothetical protein